MGFLGESAPPASCLGGPIEAGTRLFSGSRWPNPIREFLSLIGGNTGSRSRAIRAHGLTPLP